jgi:hypothetical protein
MLEPFTTSIVLIASEISTIATAVESIVGSVTMIFAAISAGLLAVSGGLAWVATILPPPTQSGRYCLFHKYVNILGGNVGHATNSPKDDNRYC